jgi:amino acid adenylation domain-containing protein
MSVDGAPSQACTLLGIAERRAATQTASVAFRFLANGEDETGHLTYGDLAARARGLAGWLRGLARPGDRAVLAYPAGLDFPVAFLACLYAGVIAVPVDVPRRKGAADGPTAIAASCGARVFLSCGAARDRLPDDGPTWVFTDEIEGDARGDAALPAPEPDAIAYLQYTSGSTRAPRGAAISHRALMQQLEDYRRRGGNRLDDLVLVGWLPHTHDFGLVGFVLSSLYLDAPYVMMPPAAFLRRPARWLEAISRYRGVYCGGPNFGYEMCAGLAPDALRGDIDLSAWRIASIGGDYIRAATLARFAAAFAPHGFDQGAWLPAYGLAESVLCATGRQGAQVKCFDAAALRRNAAVPVADGAADAVRLISCGSTLRGQEVRIVDPDTRAALPATAVGEIWLAGRSLADGYWDDAVGTASQFHATLAGDAEGARHLRTGDCGFLHDGELFVTGRLKDVIVVHGENHAPDDLEQTIQSVDPALRPGSGAVVQTAAPEGARLIAIQEVSPAAGLDHARLFAAINQAVTQRHGLTLDAIELIRAGSLPRTRNGKISRRACLAAHAEGKLRRVAGWRRAPAPPAPMSAGVVEARMLAHLRELFPDRAVGADDNLFALGLDSLALHRLLARLNESFHVDVPPHAVFEAPSVARLAGVVTGLRLQGSTLPSPEFVAHRPASGEATPQAILAELRKLNGLVAEQTRLLAEQTRLLALLARDAPPAATVDPHAPDAPADGPFPLTETQREIMMLAELREDAQAVFNIMMVLEFSAPPEIAAVRQGLRAVTTRHEALRTVIEDQQQKALPVLEPELSEVTLEAGGALADWLRAERRRPFALDRAPLWRVTLLNESGKHFLVLTAHHLILDGSSLPVLVREFIAHYTGLVPADVAPPMQFRAFCRALEAAREAGDREGRKAYWNDVLGTDLPDWAPPADAVRPSPISYEAGCHSVVLDGNLRAALVRRGASASSTLFQTLLAAYFVLLHRISGQERILIGIDSANRSRPGEEGVIGCCNGPVPIVMDFAEAASVAQFQERLRRQVVRALECRDYTMTMWEQERRIAFDPARPFKVTASMNMQRFPAPGSAMTTRFDLEAQSISHSPFGLTLEARDLDDAVRVDFVYNKQLFGADAIARYAGYYLRLLQGMAQDDAPDVLSLAMLPDAEAQALLHIGRAARAPAPFVPFLRRFAAQVAHSPLAPAVACPRERLSYRDLQARSDRLAHAIVDRRVPPGTSVALLSERGATYLAALLAILKAGCVYVPLDPKVPDARLRRQIAQADVGLLLHDEGQRDTAALMAQADARVPTLCIDAPLSNGDDAGAALPVGDPAPDAPAYVLFTSGSTGTPKAAVVSHGGLMNHLQAKIDALDLQCGDAVAQTASQAFDISVWQQLAPLLVGACVRVFDDGVTHDPQALFRAVDRHNITVLQTVPSLLAVALDIMIAPGQRPPLTALRWLISTGEALPAELCRRWIGLYPRVPVLNAYGPTECADDVTHHALIWPPAAEVVRTPIGRAIPGAELYVLDKRGRLAPTGAPGELHVGGACVGLGYLNDPERTAAAFVPDRFSDRPQARLYRTGDLVRYRDDGLLDYLGRIDQQVKINGVRIEPREIEAAIQGDPSVLQTFVTTKQRPDGTAALVAYVVLRPDRSVLEGTLKAVARNSLPQALVPAAFVFLDRLPLTASGKIDVAALPEADLRPRKFDTTPPSTPLEQMLVRIWSETIGQSGFGIHDDFFALGGRSLDATRVAKKIEGHFNFRMPLSEIFRAPTVAGIAAFLERRLAAANEHTAA